MTKCTKRQVFPFFKGALLTGDFSGGSITSDGGLLLVRQFDEHIGLSESFSKLIHDPRDPRFIQHDQLALIRQRLYQIIAGYEDANDATLLRKDPLFKALAGRCPEDLDLGSQPTFSRLENRIQRESLKELNDEMVRAFIRSRAKPMDEITLDIDPSEARTYGQQELSFFNGHYDSYRPCLNYPRFGFDCQHCSPLTNPQDSAAGSKTCWLGSIRQAERTRRRRPGDSIGPD